MATNTNINQQFPVDKNGYLSFDALTMKAHIRDRLNAGGIFTDQNYEGSNISTITDIIAYTFNVLSFYLNKTSTESLFSDAQIYENMNRIVKLLDYKPIGNQTSTLTFQASAGTGATNSPGLYNLSRYSYIDVNGVYYSFNEDITFAKSLSGQIESLTDLSNEKLLYQGQYQEYPVQTAVGQENEIVFLTPGSNIIIDHFNIDVYVKSTDGLWREWEQTPSLYLENANATKYEVRLNENKLYELKFGNNINGKKLESGDLVAIYYLQSKGSDGEVGTHTLLGKKLIKFNTLQFEEILTDVIAGQYSFLSDYSSISFDNDSVSTFSSGIESVDSIRTNAPGVFRSQYRVVTPGDHETYVKTNFANLVHDVKVINNWTYVSEYMKYFYDLGITDPNTVSRALYNQVMFGDACNFNNVYLIIVPKTISNVISPTLSLTPSQKEYIISSMSNEKMLTSEIIIMDPMYIAVDIALPTSGNNSTTGDIAQTNLLIIKDPNSRRDAASIQSDVLKVFTDYLDRTNTYLNQIIDIKELTNNILNIAGVKNFYTQRSDDDTIKYEGLSLILWNPIYPTDVTTTTKNITLEYFKYPYLNNQDDLANRIIVQAESRIFENVEY